MLTNPRRIAVVVLATLIGLALQTWARWPDAAINGALIGMLASLLVPSGSRSCSLR